MLKIFLNTSTKFFYQQLFCYKFTRIQLLNLSLYLGHIKKKWNKNFLPYIFGIRNKLIILNLDLILFNLIRTTLFLKEIIKLYGKIFVISNFINYGFKGLTEYFFQKIKQSYFDGHYIGGLISNLFTVRFTKKKFKYEFSGRLSSNKYFPSAAVILNSNDFFFCFRESSYVGIPSIGFIDSDLDYYNCNYPIIANNESFFTSIYMVIYIYILIKVTRRVRRLKYYKIFLNFFFLYILYYIYIYLLKINKYKYKQKLARKKTFNKNVLYNIYNYDSLLNNINSLEKNKKNYEKIYKNKKLRVFFVKKIVTSNKFYYKSAFNLFIYLINKKYNSKIKNIFFNNLFFDLTQNKIITSLYKNLKIIMFCIKNFLKYFFIKTKKYWFLKTKLKFLLENRKIKKKKKIEILKLIKKEKKRKAFRFSYFNKILYNGFNYLVGDNNNLKKEQKDILSKNFFKYRFLFIPKYFYYYKLYIKFLRFFTIKRLIKTKLFYFLFLKRYNNLNYKNLIYLKFFYNSYFNKMKYLIFFFKFINFYFFNFNKYIKNFKWKRLNINILYKKFKFKVPFFFFKKRLKNRKLLNKLRFKLFFVKIMKFFFNFFFLNFTLKYNKKLVKKNNRNYSIKFYKSRRKRLRNRVQKLKQYKIILNKYKYKNKKTNYIELNKLLFLKKIMLFKKKIYIKLFNFLFKLKKKNVSLNLLLLKKLYRKKSIFLKKKFQKKRKKKSKIFNFFLKKKNIVFFGNIKDKNSFFILNKLNLQKEKDINEYNILLSLLKLMKK